MRAGTFVAFLMVVKFSAFPQLKFSEDKLATKYCTKEGRWSDIFNIIIIIILSHEVLSNILMKYQFIQSTHCVKHCQLCHNL